MASRAATPIPTSAGTFSVPARRLRSCLPPVSIGCIRVPRLIHSAPAPFGPLNLCADSDSKSIPSARTSTGIFPTDWTASVCMSAPCWCAIAASSAIGWMVPISLFACITETSAVSFVTSSRRRSGSTMPVRSTGINVVCHPRRASALSVLSTASCSMALATRCRRPPGSSASAAPRMAKLSDSVPPLVYTISDGSAPDQGGDSRARLVHGGFRPLAEVMHAGRIAKLVPRCRDDRLEHLGRERGGGVVVEIDTHREPYILSLAFRFDHLR